MNENQKEENLIIKKKPEQLSRTKRFMIFLILYLISTIINSEKIIFSPYYKNINDNIIKLKISFCQSLGLFLGDILYIKISQIENRRKITFIFFLINSLLYFIYPMTENKIIFYCCRLLIKILTDYRIIFIAVWIDQIGMKGYKTILMFIHLNLDLGKITGVIMYNNIGYKKWYLNYIIFGLLMLAFDCLLLIFPEKYFSLKLNFIGYKSDKKEEYKISNDPEKISFFEEKEEKHNKTGFLKTIIKNKVYIFSILANFIFYLVNFIINLNILNYIITSYYFPNSYKQIMVSSQKSFNDFAIVFGYLYEIIGLLCIGGYENKNSAIFLGINSILNFISSLFLFFSNNSLLFSIGYFLYIFFSPSINYINVCFLINLLPNKYKGSGFALNLVFEAVGMIGPLIYGLMQDYFGKHNPTLPWKINIIFIILETTFCLIASYYRYYYKEEEIKDDNEKELEIIA